MVMTTLTELYACGPHSEQCLAYIDRCDQIPRDVRNLLGFNTLVIRCESETLPPKHLALKPWLFTRANVKLECNGFTTFGRQLLCHHCIALLPLLTDRIRYLEVIGYYVNNDYFHRLFMQCQHLKKLHIKYGGSSRDAAELFKITVSDIPKLREIKWFICPSLIGQMSATELINADNNKLRAFSLTSNGPVSGLAPWIPFVRSMKNLTVFSISNVPMQLLVENCENFSNLRELELQPTRERVGRLGHSPTAIVFTNRVMASLVSLEINYAKFMWHELATSCPHLSILKVSFCIVSVMPEITPLQCLKALRVHHVTEITKYVRPPTYFVLRHNLSALCKLEFDADSEADTIGQLKVLAKNPALLVNCRVLLHGGHICFRTNRLQRVLVHLWGSIDMISTRR